MGQAMDFPFLSSSRRCRILPCLLAGAIACGGAGGGADTTATLDTLPGGAVRVVSHRPAETGRWSLREVSRVRPVATGGGSIGWVRDLALADDGTIAVADLDPVTVHLFDADGNWLRNIGRQGSGPGEFEDAFVAWLGDTLLVQDRRTSRVNRFLVDGTALDPLPSACCLTEGVGVGSSARVLVPAPGPPDGRKLWVVASAQPVLDTITLQDTRITPPTVWQVRIPGGNSFGKLVPLIPRVRTAIDPFGTLTVAWTGEYLLRRTSDGRDTTLLFGHDALAAQTLDAAARARLAEDLARSDAVAEDLPVEILTVAYDPELLPEQPERFDAIWVDRVGRTWVQRVTPDDEAVVLDLFGRDGRWLDAVVVPRAGWPTSPYHRPVAFAGDVVIVAIEGEEGPEIVRYAINRR